MSQASSLVVAGSGEAIRSTTLVFVFGSVSEIKGQALLFLFSGYGVYPFAIQDSS